MPCLKVDPFYKSHQTVSQIAFGRLDEYTQSAMRRPPDGG